MNGPVSIPTMIEALEEAVRSMPLTELPALTGDLKRLETMAFARLVQKPEPPHGNLLDAQQVGVRLNVPVSYVYELAKRKELKATRLGKKYLRFTEAAVADYQQGVDNMLLRDVESSHDWIRIEAHTEAPEVDASGLRQENRCGLKLRVPLGT